MIEQEIGRRIKEIRKQKKIPQEKLAEMIGITPNYMSALERGLYNIKLELLVQIIDCLDITADDLFRDVIKNGYVNRTSRLSDEIEKLPDDEQQRIYEVLDALLCFGKNEPVKPKRKGGRFGGEPIRPLLLDVNKYLH